MFSTNVDVIYVILVVLLPIIPAILLYRLLPPPKTDSVTGKLSKFNIQLSGAFAGYFAVLLVLTMSNISTNKGNEVWKVIGNTDSNNCRVSVVPPIAPSMKNDGTFDIEILVKKSESGYDFPSVLVERAGYQAAIVHLDKKKQIYGTYNYDIKYDYNNKCIQIMRPIIHSSEVAPYPGK